MTEVNYVNKLAKLIYLGIKLIFFFYLGFFILGFLLIFIGYRGLYIIRLLFLIGILGGGYLIYKNNIFGLRDKLKTKKK